jgi:tetratricopeptide (TPR) repeat protein
MLDEYSVEQRAAQIFDARSKEYFSEALSCYAAGNYRSAVVTLWSVVVCDLLFKLQHLVDLYGDDKAKAILAETGKLQQANERSSEWESKMVESVAERTQLLDIAERENLLHLQRQRHLAAHPVINANFQLHRPNRDTTRALIRNALDGLLTKAPILSKKIVDDLVEDLEQASGILIDDKKLKAYLESKYFSRFNPEVEKAVFKALWKFVFRSTNERCEKNRAINYSALTLLYDRNPAQFRGQIEADRDYFSTIATGGSPLVCLIHFLSRSADIYGLLADHAKTAIQHTAEQETSARCVAWFTAPSLREHADRLHAWIVGDFSPQIGRETWDALRDISDSPEWDKAVVRLAGAYYVASSNYDDADERFNEAVRPMLPAFDLGDCVELIRGIETNGQTWERRRAYRDHRELRARALEIDAAFDPAQYEVFNRHLD